MSQISLPRNRYELPSSERATLMASLAIRTDSAQNLGQDMQLVVLDGDMPESDLGREVEQVVFDETFGSLVPHSAQMMEHEYGSYEDQSVFLMVVDWQAGQVAGVLRVIAGVRCKTLIDLSSFELIDFADAVEAYQLTETNTWDICSVAVRPEYRKGLGSQRTSLSLYRALLVFAERAAVTNWVSVIDEAAFRLLAALGIPFLPLRGLESVDYLGSTARPVYASVPSIRDAMADERAELPRLLERASLAITEGDPTLADIEQAFVPTELDELFSRHIKANRTTARETEKA